ncbi:ABC transporter substrate-binding protein [Leucobacter weissii]|uniref:ABC transporter substrate-binding protein n=1 Tax=Leucobacter weissii TaxID=1983706 RepID=A0A939S9I7_9MICO|nr:ABC transporter substrate-binding protein [Leucobacter weissii]MBO1900972.1 ABC transporter substrate-binding protein [Leucobacter weissii]
MKRKKLILVLGLAASASLALSACSGGGSDGGSGGDSLTVVSYGGPYQEAQSEAFFQPFTAESGIEVVEDSPTDYAQLRSMVDTGRPTWDLVLVANDFGTTADADYLEPVDYDAVDRDQLIPGAAQEYRVAADIEATVLAYRSDEYSEAPATWEDLFDTERFPGKRLFNKLVSGGVLEAALLADGVAPEELFPLDIDRALAKLDTIKDDIVWWETSAQSQQLLASGEASIGLVWVGRAVDAGKEAPVGINWDSWLQVDAYWVIPKGAPNAAAAQQALGFLLQEDPQVAFAGLSDYGPVNAAAAEDPEVRQNENRPTNHLDTQVAVDDEWWGANQQETDRKFQEWLLG